MKPYRYQSSLLLVTLYLLSTLALAVEIEVGSPTTATISTANYNKIEMKGSCEAGETYISLLVWANTQLYTRTVSSFGHWTFVPACQNGRWAHSLHSSNTSSTEYDLVQKIGNAEGYLHAEVTHRSGAKKDTLNIPLDTSAPQVYAHEVSIRSGTTTYSSTNNTINIETMGGDLVISFTIHEANRPATGPVQNGVIRLVGPQTHAYPVTYNNAEKTSATATIERNLLPQNGTYQVTFGLIDSLGNSTTYTHPFSLNITNSYIQLEITDRDRRVSCQASKMVGPTPDYYLFENSLCLNVLSGRTVGQSGDFAFKAPSGQVRYCSFGHLSFDGVTMQVVTTERCLDTTKVAPLATLPDFDGDGIPNLYDYDLATPLTTTGNCGTGDTAIRNIRHNYAAGTTANCATTSHIAAAHTRISGSSGTTAGAEVTYQAPTIYLGAGFRVEAGATFRAGATFANRSLRSVQEGESEGAAQAETTFSTKQRDYQPTVLAPKHLALQQLPSALRNLLYAARAEDVHHAFSDASGRMITFETAQSLLPEDNNPYFDIYLYDSYRDSLTLVSRTPEGYAANGESRHPRIDGAGTLIAFHSSAPNLTAGKGKSSSEIYLYQIDAFRLEQIVRDPSDQPAQHPTLSTWPQIVLFDQGKEGVRTLAAYYPQWPALGTHPISNTTHDHQADDTYRPAISADGSYIAYFAGNPSTERESNCRVVLLERTTSSYESFLCPAAVSQVDDEEKLTLEFDQQAGQLRLRSAADSSPLWSTAVPGL